MARKVKRSAEHSEALRRISDLEKRIEQLDIDLAIAHTIANRAERARAIAFSQVEKLEREKEVADRISKRVIDRMTSLLIESVPTIGKGA